MSITAPTPNEGTRGSSARDETWEKVAQRLDDFAAAWDEGDSPPDLREFLPDPSTSACYAALLELIKLDMEYRWNRGTPKWVENYLEEHTQLAETDQVPLELIVEEFHIRQDEERNVEAAEYLSRFPHAAEQLATLLDLHKDQGTRFHTSSARAVREVIAQYKAGDRVGEFDLVNKLGAGCFASVFLAWQRSMQRWVALKLSAAGGDEPQTLGP